MEPVILFVDDEPAILRAIKRIFRHSPWQILTAENSIDALNILQQTPISVLVSDYSMPKQTGAELLAMAKAIRPETVRMILSGNNDQDAAIDAVNHGGVFKFLTKPFDDICLINEVENAVAEWQSQIFIQKEKKLLNQKALVQLINAELLQDKSMEAIVVVLAVRDIDRMEERFGIDAVHQHLCSIAPSSESFADSLSLALLDNRYFCGFVKLANNQHDPELTARTLLEFFPKNSTIGEQVHRVAFDVGYAVVGSDETNGIALIGNAQLAMQAARECGASTAVAFNKQLTANRRKQSELESHLSTALINGEFSLYYQPKINISNNSLHGAEALIRWDSGTYGRVPPVDFIPLTERNGMIDDIGEWVINEAVRQWTHWFPNSVFDPTISVNVSSHQLKNKEFIQRLEDALTTHGIQPSLLELEITESLMVEDISKVIEILQAIKDLGVKLSIDDFGTGYSSLSYLSQLPVDIIKIDRSFIMPMLESDEKLGLVRNLIKLGHDLGMQLVAEGVEEEDQLVILRDFGCDITQGYYFSPAVAADEFIKKSCDILDLHMHHKHVMSVNSRYQH
ncbi:MAG: EAL domain-containing protein [Granulosicoccus sp.]|nr:EAL domain-containing protein [Granulosicoccus sp.]